MCRERTRFKTRKCLPANLSRLRLVSPPSVEATVNDAAIIRTLPGLDQKFPCVIRCARTLVTRHISALSSVGRKKTRSRRERLARARKQLSLGIVCASRVRKTTRYFPSGCARSINGLIARRRPRFHRQLTCAPDNTATR